MGDFVLRIITFLSRAAVRTMKDDDCRFPVSVMQTYYAPAKARVFEGPL